MDPLVELVWWVGLAGALLLTLVVLKLVFLVHRVLQDIVRLGRIILTASGGIARNVRALPAPEGRDA